MGNLYKDISLNRNYTKWMLDILMPRYIIIILLKYNRLTSTSNIAPTHRSRENMGPMHNPPSPSMTPRNSPWTTLKKSKKMSKHPLLCAGSRFDGANGIEHNCKWTNKGDRKYNIKSFTKSSNLTTHLDAKVHIWASKMVMNIHSDA